MKQLIKKYSSSHWAAFLLLGDYILEKIKAQLFFHGPLRLSKSICHDTLGQRLLKQLIC